MQILLRHVGSISPARWWHFLGAPSSPATASISWKIGSGFERDGRVLIDMHGYEKWAAGNLP